MPTLEGADKTFSANVNRLLQDTHSTLQSGYRSTQEQQKLYDAAVKKYGEKDARNWAALPGHSNHEKGIAADISNYQNITDAQLASYGLYRPMSWEPWHVEPIGSRSTAAAQTRNPATPVNETTKAIDTFGDAMSTLFSNVGVQDSVVGEQATNVGEQSSVVGDQTGITPAATTKPETATTPPTGQTSSAFQADVGDGSQLGALMAAIGAKESGGNYTATNKDSGAYGKYQIMPANWPSWSKEAGLPAGSKPTPENQEVVAKYKLGQYLQKYGVEGAAQAWYGGEGSVGKRNVSGGGNYPTVGGYGDDIKKRVNSGN